MTSNSGSHAESRVAGNYVRHDATIHHCEPHALSLEQVIEPRAYTA